MIGRELNGRQIWTELMDHHDYLVTYDPNCLSLTAVKYEAPCQSRMHRSRPS
jgi:hypothetical protein